jgi:hypothetical protein
MIDAKVHTNYISHVTHAGKKQLQEINDLFFIVRFEIIMITSSLIRVILN